MGLGPTLLLGLIAGVTILLGLPIGRLRRPAPSLRTLLNAVAIGVLLFAMALAPPGGQQTDAPWHGVFSTANRSHRPSDNMPTANGLLTAYQARLIDAGWAAGLLLGNYRILDHLGRGGMAVVYLAEHIALRRRVAIKVVRSLPGRGVKLAGCVLAGDGRK